jgi:hypothetical protein
MSQLLASQDRALYRPSPRELRRAIEIKLAEPLHSEAREYLHQLEQQTPENDDER